VRKGIGEKNKMFGKLQSTLLVHVDDILCASEHHAAHSELSEHLKKAFIDILQPQCEKI
jgi:hypothetical protein